ncbi:hypothetical protein DWX45_19675 [Erysipelotrichaceae bacterium AF19-24AC]|jgi:hypothetical protein|nr:hypothetical protein DWX45_19675 [Erysipelotrichaceae bacterium AF19-24AC]
MVNANMTTYDNILDMIIRRQGELDISNRKLAKIVAVDYQTMCNYLSYKSRMPVDAMLATMHALGIKMSIRVCRE